MPWLRDWVRRLQGVYDSEDGKASAALCILEILMTGTNCFVKVHLHKRYGVDGIAEVVEKLGIRGVLAKSVMGLKGYAADENIVLENGNKHMEKIFEKAGVRNGLLKTFISKTDLDAFKT